MSTDTLIAEAQGWRRLRDGGLEPYRSSDGYLPGWGYPTFEDTFTGESLNLDKWRPRGPEWIQTDDDAYIYAENTFLDGDGHMVLRTDYRGTTPVQGRAWGTAYVDTMGKFSQRYGRFEVRLKSLKPGKSRGIWPAFWLRDNSGGGENDVYEAVGTPCEHPSSYPDNGSGFSSTMYRQTGAGTANVDRTENYLFTLPQPYYDFHTFTCIWTPAGMTNYCDGIKTLEVLSSTSMGAQIMGGFPTQAHIRLSQHVGSNWAGHPDPNFVDTENPNDTLIDYVRVWAWNGS